MTATELTGVRASNLVGCLRKAFYDGVGIEKEQLPKKIETLFRIRKMQNDALALADAEEARALGREIVLEQVIPWGPVDAEHPQGVWEAHADFADWTDHVVREYTGSADLSPDRRKMLQSAFYAKRLTEITGHLWGAWVKVFDPSTGEDRFLSINWREIVWEIDVAVADLEAALAVGLVPERIDTAGETVCASPGDGPAMFCPYAGHCFRGFEYPIPGKLDPEGALALAAVSYANLKERTNTKLAEKDLEPLKEKLVAGLPPGGKFRIPLDGGKELEVSVTEVVPKHGSISLKEVAEAGYSIADGVGLEPFVKPPGKTSHRINYKIVDVPSA